MIEAEIPNTCIDHSVRAESHASTNDGAGQDISPVMILVGRKRTTDQRRAQDRHVSDDELEVRRMVIAPDFKFRVEVEIEKHKATERCRDMAEWE